MSAKLKIHRKVGRFYHRQKICRTIPTQFVNECDGRSVVQLWRICWPGFLLFRIRSILLEFIFETQCNHIVVKKIPYSFDDNNEIHDIYEAATGKSFDVKRGFKVSEILDKTIKR